MKTLPHAEHVMTPQEQANFLKAVGQVIRQTVEELVECRLGDFGYRGVWTEGSEYKRGNFVTHDGSLFHCNIDTKNRPGRDPVSWSLCVKRGQDGKDRAA